MLTTFMSIFLFAIGAALTGGGIWLAWLGGSWFYIVLGMALMAFAGLLYSRRPAGLALYAVTLLGTLAWSLWEVGLDWWALSARGSMLIVMALILLLPPVVRSLHPQGMPRRRYGMPSALLAASVAVAGLVAAFAMREQPHDTARAFPAERMAQTADVANAGVPDGEWQSYGRSSYSRRYSPLGQITPDNVKDLQVAWSYKTGQLRSEDDPKETTYEVTPLVINDTMYICTPFSTVIALDPVTGAEKWRFDPKLKQPPTETTQHMTCRGVSYFDGASEAAAAARTTTDQVSVAATAANLPADGTNVPSAQNADTAPASPAIGTAASASPADGGKLVDESAADVTTQAAGVLENIVTGQAQPEAPNPDVTRKPSTAPSAPERDDCVQRIFVPTSDGRLISISAETGEICPGFGGADGTINLWANMPNVTPGSAYSTSPPMVTAKAVIVGGTVNDNSSNTSPSGVIRAYDVHTGELLWNFDSKKPDQTAPIAEGETYSENAPNSWSVSSYDPELNLVYLPMGNQSPDQYGGNRSAEVEAISSSVIALDADTGELRWTYQTVHHDLWDMDVPAQPSLIDLTIDGATVPALVQPTKQGEIFVLDRRTGKPVLPVTETKAPEGAVEGDTTAPTQPISAISFNPKPLTEASMWGATPLDQLYCRIQFKQMRYEGRYTPPSEQGTIVYPGNFGTFNWGAVAVDPERQVMFAMPVYLAFTSRLIERPDDTTRMVTEDVDPVFNENLGSPYAVEMGTFTSPIGLPCQQPPWGYVAGVDLTNGKTIYQHVNGTVRDLSPVPLPFEMGVPGIGGPIVTKGGVAFLSGTLDYYVRGYDLRSGAELWRSRLPAGGQATPSTYLGRDGRQYLVVVAGGHGSTGTKAGDSIIAYALPK